jgi:RNA polymerase sigma factor (sigma-70 family)
MSELSTTIFLLNRIQSGDQSAIDQLVKIYYPILLNWAKGRMPFYHRDLVETSDIVHEALMSVIKKMDVLKAERTGAFFAYLRTTILNRIRREISQSKVRPQANANTLNQSQLLHSDHLDLLMQYDQALEQLDEPEREAVMMRFEFGLSFEEVAKLIDKPTADAARMFIKRSLLKLTQFMS